MTDQPAPQAPREIPAGWYPDPEGKPQSRYWDGVTWTDQVGPLVPQPAPTIAGAFVPVTHDAVGNPVSDRSRLAAALLCFFLGVFGVHRFYVGKVGTGILQVVDPRWARHLGAHRPRLHPRRHLPRQAGPAPRQLVTAGPGPASPFTARRKTNGTLAAAGTSSRRPHAGGQRRHELAVCDPHLHRADEQGGVERDHDRVVRAAALHRSSGESPRRMPSRHDELDDPLQGDEGHQAGEDLLGRHAR